MLAYRARGTFVGAIVFELATFMACWFTNWAPLATFIAALAIPEPTC